MSNSQKTVLVIGGTGAQGAPVVKGEYSFITTETNTNGIKPSQALATMKYECSLAMEIQRQHKNSHLYQM
jgi:hypothetical protein